MDTEKARIQSSTFKPWLPPVAGGVTGLLGCVVPLPLGLVVLGLAYLGATVAFVLNRAEKSGVRASVLFGLLQTSAITACVIFPYKHLDRMIGPIHCEGQIQDVWETLWAEFGIVCLPVEGKEETIAIHTDAALPLGELVDWIVNQTERRVTLFHCGNDRSSILKGPHLTIILKP